MARVLTGLSDGILSTGVNSIFTASASTVLTNLALTNTDTTIKSVDIYLNRGTSRIFASVSIPAGVGKIVAISQITNVVLDSGDEITITATDGAINYDMSGWAVT